MRRIGMFVIVAGVILVILSAVKVSHPREVARVGGVRITLHEDQRPLLPAWIGGVVAAVGVALVVVGKRNPRGHAT